MAIRDTFLTGFSIPTSKEDRRFKENQAMACYHCVLFSEPVDKTCRKSLVCTELLTTPDPTDQTKRCHSTKTEQGCLSDLLRRQRKERPSPPTG